jgi:hypothetical protein
MHSPNEGGNRDAFQVVTEVLLPTLIKAAPTAFLDTLKHFIDAAFTWSIGVLSGLQDVIQTVDMANCKLPDFFMQVRAYTTSDAGSSSYSSGFSGSVSDSSHLQTVPSGVLAIAALASSIFSFTTLS